MAIHVLPPEIAAKIAAGEVVERPAAVAKELIENALDAGATRIDIEARAGGVGLLRVVDNGCGIVAEDVPVAFQRYATSKLSSTDDLERITTHGFRGEALPSIAAVGDVALLTRPPDQLAGTFLRLVEGKVLERSSRGAPPGTSITVRDLFRNVPARLKFLKSNAAEGGRIIGLVVQYALAYPEVHFSMTLDGKRVFESEGDGDLRQTATRVYGLDAAAGMLPVAWEEASAGQPISVRGLISPPAVSRSNRSYINLFVNRRLVQNRSLVFAIEDAYQGLLMTGRHPIAVLDMTIDPAETDVNVHPSKMEIKFRDEGMAFSAVRKAVQQALGESGLARPTAGLVPAARFAISSSEAPPRPIPVLPLAAPLGTGIRVPNEIDAVLSRISARSSPSVVGSSNQPSVAAQHALPQTGGALPILRPLGQVNQTYIVAEGPEGMYLIDQHAAHERVLFDRFRNDRAQGVVPVQGLLDPVTVELTHDRAVKFEEAREMLRAYGFGIEPFGQRSVLIRAMPASLVPKGAARALLDILDTVGEERLAGYSWDDRVLTVLACHSAVRAGEHLAQPEQTQLLRLLEATDNPRTCPHGRPTMLHMSSLQLEREFGRR